MKCDFNIIGKFNSKPNAYYIGKYHENWAYSIIREKPESDIVSNWLNALWENTVKESDIIAFNSILPQSHIEKSDFLISVLTKKNNIKKTRLEGISAKSGTTTLCGQIYRGTLVNASQKGFAPDENHELYPFHKEWLINRKDISDIDFYDKSKVREWYQDNWNYIKEKALFGIETQSSALLLSDLIYDEQEGNLLVDKTVLISKEQVLKDLEVLSSSSEVDVTLSGRGKIKSGIIHIQRAGGSNGEKGAEDWQARIDRSNYIKWIEKMRPNTVWRNHFNKDMNMH